MTKKSAHGVTKRRTPPIHQPRPSARRTLSTDLPDSIRHPRRHRRAWDTRYPRCGAILRRRYRVSPVRRKRAGKTKKGRYPRHHRRTGDTRYPRHHRRAGDTRYLRWGAFLRRRYRVSPVRRKRAGKTKKGRYPRHHRHAGDTRYPRHHRHAGDTRYPRHHRRAGDTRYLRWGAGRARLTPATDPARCNYVPLTAPLHHGRPHPNAPTWSQPGLGRGTARLQPRAARWDQAGNHAPPSYSAICRRPRVGALGCGRPWGMEGRRSSPTTPNRQAHTLDRLAKPPSSPRTPMRGGTQGTGAATADYDPAQRNHVPPRPPRAPTRDAPTRFQPGLGREYTHLHPGHPTMGTGFPRYDEVCGRRCGDGQAIFIVMTRR